MDPAAVIIAITSLLTVISGGFITLMTTRSTVRKNDIEALEGTIQLLRSEVDRQAARAEAQEKKSKDQQTEIDFQKDKLDEQDRKIWLQQKEIERLQNNEAELNEERAARDIKIANLVKENENNIAKNRILEREMAALRAKVIELGGKIDTGKLNLEKGEAQ